MLWNELLESVNESAREHLRRWIRAREINGLGDPKGEAAAAIRLLLFGRRDGFVLNLNQQRLVDLLTDSDLWNCQNIVMEYVPGY